MDIPELILKFGSYFNDRQFDALASLFDEDATVTDEGRTIVGRNAIRTWAEDATREYEQTMSLKNVEPSPGGSKAEYEVSGGFDGSPILISFDFAHDERSIQRLSIE